MLQTCGDTVKIAHPIAIAVLKAAWVYLIDDSALPPGCGCQDHRGARKGARRCGLAYSIALRLPNPAELCKLHHDNSRRDPASSPIRGTVDRSPPSSYWQRRASR